MESVGLEDTWTLTDYAQKCSRTLVVVDLHRFGKRGGLYKRRDGDPEYYGSSMFSPLLPSLCYSSCVSGTLPLPHRIQVYFSSI